MPTAGSEKKLVRDADGKTYYVILPDGSKHEVVPPVDAAVKGIVAGAEAALKEVFDRTEASLASGVKIGFAEPSAYY
jgi:hypothetical protein